MTIRHVDEQLKARLRVQAVLQGGSMEEARDIRCSALSAVSGGSGSLVDAIRARIEPIGGVDLDIAPREAMRESPDFDA